LEKKIIYPVGVIVGYSVGIAKVGIKVGIFVGSTLGSKAVGTLVGISVGTCDGTLEGTFVGMDVGIAIVGTWQNNNLCYNFKDRACSLSDFYFQVLDMIVVGIQCVYDNGIYYLFD
jgi:hypothetical protein